METISVGLLLLIAGVVLLIAAGVAWVRTEETRRPLLAGG